MLHPASGNAFALRPNAAAGVGIIVYPAVKSRSDGANFLIVIRDSATLDNHLSFCDNLRNDCSETRGLPTC